MAEGLYDVFQGLAKELLETKPILEAFSSDDESKSSESSFKVKLKEINHFITLYSSFSINEKKKFFSLFFEPGHCHLPATSHHSCAEIQNLYSVLLGSGSGGISKESFGPSHSSVSNFQLLKALLVLEFSENPLFKWFFIKILYEASKELDYTQDLANVFDFRRFIQYFIGAYCCFFGKFLTSSEKDVLDVGSVSEAASLPLLNLERQSGSQSSPVDFLERLEKYFIFKTFLLVYQSEYKRLALKAPSNSIRIPNVFKQSSIYHQKIESSALPPPSALLENNTLYYSHLMAFNFLNISENSKISKTLILPLLLSALHFLYYGMDYVHPLSHYLYLLIFNKILVAGTPLEVFSNTGGSGNSLIESKIQNILFDSVESLEDLELDPNNPPLKLDRACMLAQVPGFQIFYSPIPKLRLNSEDFLELSLALDYFLKKTYDSGLVQCSSALQTRLSERAQLELWPNLYVSTLHLNRSMVLSS